VQADFVSDIDGYPISASAQSLQGPVEAMMWTYVLVPLALFVGRYAPLRVATLLPGLRLAPRYAYLLRRIRGNMRSAPLLFRGAADGFDRLVRENYDGIGRMYLERLLLTELPPRRLERWVRERCKISGLDNLDRARAAGRGAILVGFHLGSYSLIPYLVASRGYAVTFFSGPEATSDGAINRRIAELRAAGQDCRLTWVGGALGVRALTKRIRLGETAIVLCDSGVGAGQGIEIQFLGRWLRATEGTAWLARRTGAPLLPVVITWQADGSHHLSIEREVHVASSIDDSCYIRDVTSAVHAVLERQILRTPAQWFKWKDLHEMSSPIVEIPEGEASH
jgi:lauroyl/myristoyl acyltransferase